MKGYSWYINDYFGFHFFTFIKYVTAARATFCFLSVSLPLSLTHTHTELFISSFLFPHCFFSPFSTSFSFSFPHLFFSVSHFHSFVSSTLFLSLLPPYIRRLVFLSLFPKKDKGQNTNYVFLKQTNSISSDKYVRSQPFSRYRMAHEMSHQFIIPLKL